MPRQNKLFREWATAWLASVKTTVKGNTFAASYRNPVEKHIIPYFHGKKLNEVSQIDIQTYLNRLAVDYSRDTVKKHKSCLCQMFDAAIENDLCAKNPVRKLKIPQTKERAEKKIYTPRQAELIFDYGYLHRFGAEIQFTLATGVSRGELLALRWRDIDFENRVVHVTSGVALVPNARTDKQETVLGDTKNKYRKRVIPISKEIAQILDNLPRKSVFVFCNVKGEVNNPRTWSRRHYDVFMQDMREHYAERGIDVPVYPPHQLRHTRLSLWVNEGKSPIAVAKVAGHADMDMLRKHYSHSDAEDLRELLDIG